MSVSPVANRSFLHGDRKPQSPTSEKIIYATLDRLALKRTTLPLQLLPSDDDSITGVGVNRSKRKRNIRIDATVGGSGIKVNTRCLSSKQHAEYLLVVSSVKPDSERETQSKIIDEDSDSVTEQQQNEKQDITCSQPNNFGPDDSDIDDVTSVKVTRITTTTDTDVQGNPNPRNTGYGSNDRCSSRNENAISLGVESNGNESLSNDYEKIDRNVRKEANKRDEHLENKEDRLYVKDTFVKSKSINDLTSKYSSDMKLVDGEPLVKTYSQKELVESLLFNDGLPTHEKKKKHFAKHVLHYVPEYLVKGPKKKQKKKNSLSESLSSLKTISLESKTELNCNGRYRSRSLSREALKYPQISSPTNFVHVASATNPNLVTNENTIRFNLEQVVIMHEQKCATLPLLVAIDNENSMTGHRTGESSNTAVEGTTSFDASSIVRESKDEAARKNDAFDVANLKRELLAELQTRTANVLESSQQVKTNEHPANVHQGKITYEPPRFSTCSLSRADLSANSSFLWCNRTKSLLENARCELLRAVPNENIEEIDGNEQYDDAGPLNLISQEDDYDDVGVPMSCPEGNRIGVPSVAFQDSDDIYDDVVGPRSTGNTFVDNETEIRKNESNQDDDDDDDDDDNIDDDIDDNDDEDYLFVINEYSSVYEDTNDILDNDQDVYDDVGLPSEERVNSLYADSTTGSILGYTWTYGKESEWEDLEDSSAIGSSDLANRSSLLSTATQVVPNKKRSGQRCSRKMRRQRSKVSRKTLKSPSKLISQEFVFQVAVSLGSGSVLLVGCTEKIEEWRKEEYENQTRQENPPRTQGLVQMRVIDLDEDVDTQETSCFVHEENASDDSTYESLHFFQPDDFSSTDSETEKTDETMDRENVEYTETDETATNRLVIAYLEAPTRPNPPPPRELSTLTRTLGRRIKMLRRTWSITKGSLGRMRKRASVEDDHSCEGNKESSNDHSNLDAGKYFSFARHFKKTVTGPFSTFYLNGYTMNGNPTDPPATARNCCNDQTNSNTESIYSNTTTNEETDRYSILVDQEPLYQFYVAAATRVAFDSNSDGYEEVEGMIPSRSTTDLAKPGHRTLWCQTPQVINNGLLQRLSTEEKKIQEAKFEILTSEASFLNSLRVLRNEFLNESSIDEILTPSEKDQLFGGIPSVLQASEQFLAELESVWSHDPMLHGLPDVLLKYADNSLDIYVAYCSNQVSIDMTLKQLSSRKGLKFVETISQIEARSTCQSLSLHSFLMLPMQRITRLPLLADAVLSKLPIEHDDRSNWEKVFSTFSYIVTECNEGARTAAKEIEMDHLAKKLEYSLKIKPIVLKGKHLVKSGPVVQLLTKADTEYKLTFGKRFNKTPLYLLLLTDYLLIAKYKSNTRDETYTVIDTCKRSLIALESIPEDSPFAGRNAMLLTLLENYSGHQVEYILTCESNTERQRWLEAVSPSKLGLIGETLYEVWDCPQVVALYCYSPNQPDELSLHPGDVINVFRKMSDGWYHGEKLLNGEQGWFPGNYTKEVASEHVRAKNLKQRYRFLTLSGNLMQRRTKQQSIIH